MPDTVQWIQRDLSLAFKELVGESDKSDVVKYAQVLMGTQKRHNETRIGIIRNGTPLLKVCFLEH